MFYNSKLRKTEKQRKSAFPNLGKSKNATGCISPPWKAKNAENHSSLVNEMQKLPKTVFRL